MRLRFRLRTMLVLTAIIAAACYWWVAWPTIVAKRFVEAVNRGDYAAADRMIHRGQDHFAVEWAEFADKRGFQVSAELGTSYRVGLAVRRHVSFLVSKMESDQKSGQRFLFEATPRSIQSRNANEPIREPVLNGVRPVVN